MIYWYLMDEYSAPVPFDENFWYLKFQTRNILIEMIEDFLDDSKA